MTIAAARARLSHVGIILRVEECGEYRVYPRGCPEHWCEETTVQAALDTGLAIARERSQAIEMHRRRVELGQD